MALKRFYEQNIPYFITSVTENRKEIFSNKLAGDLLINILLHYKFTCSYNVSAFVIMPDHFHLIVNPYGNNNISEIMKMIKGSFGRFYNKLTGSSGTVLQKGFFDEAIRNEKQLLETINYIHANPVRKGLVDNIEKYHYSSYGFYHGKDKNFELLLKEVL